MLEFRMSESQPLLARQFLAASKLDMDVELGQSECDCLNSLAISCGAQEASIKAQGIRERSGLRVPLKHQVVNISLTVKQVFTSPVHLSLVPVVA